MVSEQHLIKIFAILKFFDKVIFLYYKVVSGTLLSTAKMSGNNNFVLPINTNEKKKVFLKSFIQVMYKCYITGRLLIKIMKGMGYQKISLPEMLVLDTKQQGNKFKNVIVMAMLREAFLLAYNLSYNFII